MAKLSTAILAVVFTGLVLGVGSHKAVDKRDTFHIQIQNVATNDVLKWFCDDNPFSAYFSICDSYRATTSTTSTTTGTTTMDTREGSSTARTSTETTKQPSTTTTSATSLERAHWCQLPNQTYIPLGLTFMYTECDLCQCTQSHKIRCTTLQCMPTYCIDNTVPSRKSGQCCKQCAYEVNSTSCVQNGVTFPHGTILRRTSDNVHCWCQLGSIECRKSASSILSGMDLWGEGTAVYIVIIILCAFLIIGTILCGGCALFYYYYYYHNQSSAEQAYWNNAGWQPMDEQEQAGVDGSAEQKEVEAEQVHYEQHQPAGFSPEYVPPPYALYNGTYGVEQKETNQKYI